MAQSSWNKDPKRPAGGAYWLSASEPQHYALIIVLLAALVGSIWYYFHYEPDYTQPKSSRPLIQAEPGPYRIRPENYGKVDIQHQDKQIYATLEDDAHANEVVKSAPVMEEVPLVIEPTPVPSAEAPPPPSTETPSAEAVSAPQAVPQPPAPSVEPIPVLPAQQVKAAAKLMQKVVDSPPQRKDLAKQGVHWVRLATLQNHDSALKESNRLQKMFKEIFGNKTASIAVIDLDSGGRLFPIYLGPFESSEDAQKVCVQIKNKVGCLVEKLQS